MPRARVQGLLESKGPLPPYQKMDLEIMRSFDKLDQKGKIMAEYVWIGGNNEMRCKTRTLPKMPATVAELPVWNFDGSSTEQAPGSDSEVLMKPAAFFPDPFRPGGPNILVLCDCYLPDPNKPLGLGAPIPTNTRAKCKDIMDAVAMKIPWFGIEQEYTLFVCAHAATLSNPPAPAPASGSACARH